MVALPIIAGLLAGFVGIHLLAWIALIIITLLMILWTIMGWIMAFIGVIASIIKNFCLWIVVSIWSLFGWWLLLPVGIALIALLIMLIPNVRFNLRRIVQLVAGGAVVGVLVVIFPPIWRFLVDAVWPILQSIWRILLQVVLVLITIALWIVQLMLFIALFSALGRLLIDQIRSTATASDGPKGTFLGAFGISSAFTLIFLATVGRPELAQAIDQGWSMAWQWLFAPLTIDVQDVFFVQWSLSNTYLLVMPDWLREVVLTWLANASVPLFDIFVTMVILTICCLLFCVQLVHDTVEIKKQPTVSFFRNELIITLGSFLVAILMVFAQVFENSD